MFKLRHRLLDQTNGGDPGTTPPGNTPPGNTPPAWFGEAHKEFVSNKGWKSGDDAITSFQNLEKLVGADKAGRTIVLPKDANDAEGIKAFRAKIGVPESADKYELPVPDGEDKAFAGKAAEWFHKAGVPKEAAVAIASEWNGYLKALVADADKAIKAHSDGELGKIKAEWGAKFDERSENARRFMRDAGWSEEKIGRYEQAFGTAEMLRDFDAFGAKFGEHSFVPGDGQPGMKLTKEQAAAKIESIRADRVAGKIAEKDFHAQMAQLGPIANPG